MISKDHIISYGNMNIGNCLHIQLNLDRFRNTFNTHKIRTENWYLTPVQLIEMYHAVRAPPVEVDEEYGVDPEINIDNNNNDQDGQDEEFQEQLHPLDCPFTPGQFDYFKLHTEPFSRTQNNEQFFFNEYFNI